jgi:hypothetical protein
LQSESYKLAKPNRIQTQDQGKTNKDKERNKRRREQKKEDFGKARSHSTPFSGQGSTLQQIQPKKRNKPNNNRTNTRSTRPTRRWTRGTASWKTKENIRANNRGWNMNA